jgi:hypothetical protein
VSNLSQQIYSAVPVSAQGLSTRNSATALSGRRLAEATGAWDTRTLSDDDDEYFCRVLLTSKRTRFVRMAGVY